MLPAQQFDSRHGYSVMATGLLDTWQSLTADDTEYVLGKTYAAVHSALFDAESAPSVKLHLAGNHPLLKATTLKDLDVQILFQALEQFSALVHTINLSYNSLTDDTIGYLLPYLKHPTCCLEVLDLSYTDISADGVEQLANVLQLNKSVESLQLHGCKMGRRGGISVASMLQINSTIQFLGLSSADLETDTVIALCTVLQGNRSLRVVDLGRPLLYSLQEEHTIHLCKMLKVNFTLQELHLTAFGMSDTGAEWICNGLRENVSLIKLNLSMNKLSRDGAGHFARLLRGNPCLQQLDLSYNRIEDEGLVWLSQALLENRNLSRLSVCHNAIGDTGLCALADLLRINGSLKGVKIWGNKMGEPTCLAFYELLQSERLLPENTDVEPYRVDGVNYLALTR